jgi:hypothetical protein
VCFESQEGSGVTAAITVLQTEPLVLELCLPGFGDQPIQLSVDSRRREVTMGIRAHRSIRIRRSELPRE